MAKTDISFTSVSFRYDTAASTIFDNISFSLGPGWTAVCGANGAGKTTLLKLAGGILSPQSGSVSAPDPIAYCEQRTDELDETVTDFYDSYDAESFRLKGVLGLQEDWLSRWDTLSHGERKRMQIAALLWQEPELLLVDEPTNHLDGEAKKFVFDALSHYNGIGLLVSHDRLLMDMLCTHSLYVEPPDIDLRSGNYSDSISQKEREEEHTKNEYVQTRNTLQRLKREAHRREQIVAANERKRTKKHLRRNDSDGRRKIDVARVTGKDAAATKLSAGMKKRVDRTQEQLQSISPEKQYDIGIWVKGTRSHHSVIYSNDEMTIHLGEETVLRVPGLRLGAAEKVGISGPNGSGKSSLIRYLIDHIIVPREKIIFVPQEIGAERSSSILKETTSLPNAELGRMMTIISRLGSRPDRLLDSELPSPGEMRKLLLAKGIMGEPHCIVMDEPTNHMDLPSIQCLEDALKDAPCALVLVSHDVSFLEALAGTRWTTVRDGDDYRLRVKV